MKKIVDPSETKKIWKSPASAFNSRVIVIMVVLYWGTVGASLVGNEE